MLAQANSDYVTLRRRSVMTPVESAIYLDVPNLLMVQSSETEAPYGRIDQLLAGYCGRHPSASFSRTTSTS